MNAKKRPASLVVALLAVAAVCASAVPARAADESIAANPLFTAEEIKVILSHGPWPMPARPDPTNRASGKPAAIEFGTRLFFDQRLSRAGDSSCASCHIPERNWSDNLRRGIGMTELDRKTPTLMNLRGQRWFGWDGAADSLWSQSLRPMVDHREMASSVAHIARIVREDEQLSCRYRKTFGVAPSAADDEGVFVNVGKALASFIETLVSGRTPFDQFRDTLASGRTPGDGTYSEAAQRGLKIFIGKGACTTCHMGPNFTNGEFFSTGLSRFAPGGKADPGRPEGIKRLLSSRFNLLGAYNDDTSGASAAQTRKAALENTRDGDFKVPSLRNIVLMAPYGRDGSVDSLADVVRHYASVDPVRLHAKDGKPGKRLDLTAQEQRDLVVFLESLSTFTNGWRPDDGGRCE
jgi:cytochrome c peroxidase